MTDGGGVLAGVTRRITMSHIRHVEAVDPRQAEGVVAHVYRRVEHDFGMLAPPVALHSPAPDLLAAVWLMLRESLLTGGVLHRAVREAVAAAVSDRNRCPYCVDVHGSALIGLIGGTDAAAIAAGRFDDVAGSAMRAVVGWAGQDGGATSAPPSWGPGALAEATAVALTFEYLNRMVNIFLQPSPLPAGSGWAGRRVGARVMGRLARRAGRPGVDLDLLPSVPLPADLAWAGKRAPIAEALGRTTAVFEAAGSRSVPEPVRALVARRAAAGTAATTKAEIDEAVSALPAADQLAGRLAISTAEASYRVPVADIEAYRLDHGDGGLLELTGWAAFTAARHRAARLDGHGTLVTGSEPAGRCPVTG
ncbi:carboxymuconolactone decarboxylase family protein [Actinoplanes sp. LDG1-06]|uniref:Carboxymuconolactone decarboxylase family protein n=1 Tax=Paractinoplanes ovalisporus TaxID=2810368 RepID=A0ABS2AK14_9ACTN|nr:carboxymuconolactone decarboxylase family protein [Actinoplanes ovalisporus]MBM2620120.1 carboxymuconolactone decarboxylase family protein [Actinoplanes ovalisporus]